MVMTSYGNRPFTQDANRTDVHIAAANLRRLGVPAQCYDDAEMKIPEVYQLMHFGAFTIDGALTIDGELVIV